MTRGESFDLRLSLWEISDAQTKALGVADPGERLRLIELALGTALPRIRRVARKLPPSRRQ